MNQQNLADFIWNVADTLRGPFKPSLYAGTKGAEQVECFAKLKKSGKSFDSFDAFVKAASVKGKAVLDAFGERDPQAQPALEADGKTATADADLREFENVPLKEDIHAYFQCEVLPHVPDAWIDLAKTDEHDGKTGIVGYEINFNRYFYVYQPPRPLAQIDAELKAVEAEIAALLGG